MDTQDTSPTLRKGFGEGDPKPRSMLLVAYAPRGAVVGEYFVVRDDMHVGRDPSCRLTIDDNWLSRDHFRVLDGGKKTFIEDLGSSNGTFVNGKQIHGVTRLKNNSVINAGHTLLVYVENADEVHFSHHNDLYGMTGRFHATCISRSLEESARSRLNLLLSGPSGTGKELAAWALGKILDRPLTVQNAARFSSSEEAAASLFGVGPKVFSGVSDRAGFIEQAEGGILFLDEAHNLPRRLQKSLLRVIEDGVLVRIGETEERKVDIRFVLASNKKGRTNGLVKDLYNRLRVVDIPPLTERQADIPDLFNNLLDKAFKAQGVSAPPAADLLRTAHYESLMLDGFEDANIRGMLGIVDKIATRAATDVSPAQAIAEIFTLRYGKTYPKEPPLPPKPQRKYPPPIDHAAQGDGVEFLDRATMQPIYPRLTADIPKPDNEDPLHEAAIILAFHWHKGNVSAMERELRKKGINYSRKKISKILDDLDLPRGRRRG